MKAKKSAPAKVMMGVAAAVIVLLLVFLIGRYGWKLGGFRACEGAGINSVEVTASSVQLTGFYPGSFPEGFCGYYAEEENGKLYVGFHFSAVFGSWKTGDFTVTIPIKGEIDEVILKTGTSEIAIWSRQAGLISQREPSGGQVCFLNSRFPMAENRTENTRD